MEDSLAEHECAEERWGSGLFGVGGKASRDTLSVVWSLAGALVQGDGSREESRAGAWLHGRGQG